MSFRVIKLHGVAIILGHGRIISQQKKGRTSCQVSEANRSREINRRRNGNFADQQPKYSIAHT